jgi:hypothetical protein
MPEDLELFAALGLVVARVQQRAVALARALENVSALFEHKCGKPTNCEGAGNRAAYDSGADHGDIV